MKKKSVKKKIINSKNSFSINEKNATNHFDTDLVLSNIVDASSCCAAVADEDLACGDSFDFVVVAMACNFVAVGLDYWDLGLVEMAQRASELVVGSVAATVEYQHVVAYPFHGHFVEGPIFNY